MRQPKLRHFNPWLVGTLRALGETVGFIVFAGLFWFVVLICWSGISRVDRHLVNQGSFTKPSVPSPDAFLDEAVGTFRRAVRRPADGETYFSVPESAKRYEAFEALLVVGPKELQSLLEKTVKDNLSDGSRPVPNSKETTLTKTMSAALTGGDKFQIDVVGSPTQLVLGKRAVTWRWMVTPKEVGEFALTYALTMPVETKDKTVVAQNVQSETSARIYVHKDPWGFFKEHWEVFLTAIILPLIAYAWMRLTGTPKVAWSD